MTADPLLKVVFIIREEYLAHLEKYCSILPDRLRIRFHLEPLRKDAALSAIEGPLIRFGYTEVAHQVAERIVDDLLKTQVEDVFGSIVETSGEYVEPVYLQVVSQRLWRKGLPADQKSISKTALGNVNEALEEFFTDAIKSTAKQTGMKEGIIRDWCEKKLITSTGTRGIVHREAALTGGISNHVIDLLEQKYLVRRERRAGASWYELTHDRLLKPILDSNKKWKKIKRKKRLKLTIPAAIGATIGATLIILFLFPPPISSVNTFNVGTAVSSIAVNTNNNFVYVANTESNSISAIDGATDKVVSQIAVSGSPSSVSVNPKTDTVYVAGPKTITIINGSANKVLSNKLVGIGPSFLAVNPISDTVYVADSTSNVTYVYDDLLDKVVSQIAVSGSPSSVSVNPLSDKVYVANTGSNSIDVIDGVSNKVISQIALSGSPSSVSVNPSTNTVYVADSTSNVTYVIDGGSDKVVQSIAVGLTPSSVSVNPLTDKVYVSNTGSNSISAIDGATDKVVSDTTVGIGPSFLAVNPNTNTIYLASLTPTVSESQNQPPAAVDQPDTVDLLTELIPQISNEYLRELPFSDLDSSQLSLIIAKVPADKAGIILNKVPVDKREEILSKIPADKRQEIMKNLIKQ